MPTAASFTWQELTEATQGQVVSHHKHFEPCLIETDTRQFQQKNESPLFFVPIVGQNFDGHNYIAEAYHQGAVGSFASQEAFKKKPDLSRFPNLIVVPDTTMALLQLGRHNRERCGATVVAITGSSGKTTTKDMLYLLVSQKRKTQKSEKNHNNEIGVAQTLLNLKPETEVLIVEMGMRGLRQIAPLTLHAKPDIALITIIGPAHIGLLGSLEAIAEAKTEIFEGLDPETGIAVLNGDDGLMLRTAEQKWQNHTETFSLHELQNIHRLNLTTEDGQVINGHQFDYDEITFKLGVPGQHNIMNALACLKICQALNINIKHLGNTLLQYDGGDGRWQKTALNEHKNQWVINDAYNSNPQSLKASLLTFWDTPMPNLQKVAVIGYMAELGDLEEQYFQDLAEWLVSHDKQIPLVLIGQKMYPVFDQLQIHQMQVQWFEDTEAASQWLDDNHGQNSIYLLKASREAQLEKIIAHLQPKTLLNS